MKLSKTVRRLLWVGAALVVAALVLWWAWPEPTSVDVARVEQGPLEVTVDAQGVTRMETSRIVAAPFTGALDRITLEAGDRVKEGEVLARMRPVALDPVVEAQTRAELQAARARQDQAKAAIAAAEAALKDARRERARARELLQGEVISRQAYEDAVLALEQARERHESAVAQAQAAAAEVTAARARLDSAARANGGGSAEPIVAPRSGTVLRVAEEGPRVVAAGTPLLELGQPGVLEVVADVLSTDAVRIQRGAQVHVKDWGGGAPLRAVVTRVEPSARTKVSALGVEEQRVDVIARLANPPPALGHGYRVETEIVVWSASDVLQVPRAALFRVEDGWAAYVVDEGRADLQGVRIGARGEEAAQVLAGLEAGQLVIVHPPPELEEGARVRPEELPGVRPPALAAVPAPDKE